MSAKGIQILPWLSSTEYSVSMPGDHDAKSPSQTSELMQGTVCDNISQVRHSLDMKKISFLT